MLAALKNRARIKLLETTFPLASAIASVAVQMWFGCGSEIRFGCGSDAVRMWFRRGSDVVRTWFGRGLDVGRRWLGRVCEAGADSLAEVKGKWFPANKTNKIDRRCPGQFGPVFGQRGPVHVGTIDRFMR